MCRFETSEKHNLACRLQNARGMCLPDAEAKVILCIVVHITVLLKWKKTERASSARVGTVETDGVCPTEEVVGVFA